MKSILFLGNNLGKNRNYNVNFIGKKGVLGKKINNICAIVIKSRGFCP